jgi:hypothetical protein
MGMFDELYYEGIKYQTKDTPKQSLDNYKIEVDQDSGHSYLWHEDYDVEWVESEGIFGGSIRQFNERWVHCDDFSGKIRFYRSASNDKHESWKRNTWIEYEAIFENGQMTHIKQAKEMKKVIRDGKVAVLISPNYGAGWYTWHGVEELLYHPRLIEMIENNQHEEITESFIAELLGIIDEDSIPHISGAEDLIIEWLPVGTQFIIEEYDGYESILMKETLTWLTA